VVRLQGVLSDVKASCDSCAGERQKLERSNEEGRAAVDSLRGEAVARAAELEGLRADLNRSESLSLDLARKNAEVSEANLRPGRKQGGQIGRKFAQH
jgi:hypothetical protein